MRFGLERMRRLLTALGSPQERFAAIHVVGTNGKSSTVRMTAALLEAHGVRTGSYLSPHLVTLRRADPDRRRGPLRRRRSAPRSQRAAAAAAKVDRTLSGGERVTQFELLTAAALDELARREVEVAVVEAGPRRALGRHQRARRGGLRAHQRRARAHPLARPDGRRTSPARSSPWSRPDATLVLGEVDAEVRALARRQTGARIVRRGAARRRRSRGYQRTNFEVAAAAATRASTARSSAAQVAEVAARVRVPGRLQVVAEDPLTILDGAHNPSGMAALAAALPDVVGDRAAGRGRQRARRQGRRGHAPRADREAVRAMVFTASRNPRALPPATLASLAAQLGGPPTEIVRDPHAAARARARELAGPDGAVLATGSIYLVADLVGEAGARRASAL